MPREYYKQKINLFTWNFSAIIVEQTNNTFKL